VRAEALGCSVFALRATAECPNSTPRVKTLGFYEADFVKTGGEYLFLLIFCSFWPTSGDSPPVWLWRLITAAAFAPPSDQTPKSVTSPARNVVGSRRATE
jgi:hypothetical protein